MMVKKYSTKSLSEIAGGDKDFMLIIAKIFLEKIPPDLKAMQVVIGNNNRKLAYQFAHKMKLNLEIFGLNLGKKITSIESWTKNLKNKSTIETHLKNVVATLESTFIELKRDFKL